jgi:hypothetical protein
MALLCSRILLLLQLLLLLLLQLLLVLLCNNLLVRTPEHMHMAACYNVHKRCPACMRSYIM